MSWPLPERPTVSVVVATRDRPEMLLRALRAIAGQEYRGGIDVHVVFDQCAPRPIPTSWLEKAPPGAQRSLTTHRNSHTPGLPGARNTGIDAAVGEAIAFCDDDDEWFPAKLDLQVSTMVARDDRCMVGGGIEVDFAGHRRTRLADRGEVTFDDVLRERIMALHPSTFVFKTDALRRQIGPVDESIPGGYGEDYDLMLRASRIAPILSVPGPLARIYWHQTSFFSDRWQQIAAANEYLKAKHPEFGRDAFAAAWLDGKTAFALAASGERSRARTLAVGTLRTRPQQRQALAALVVSTGLVRASWIQRAAQTLGRGV